MNVEDVKISKPEKDVLDILIEFEVPTSAYEISKLLNRSWYYTIHVLRGLVDKELIVRSRKGYYAQYETRKLLENRT